MKIRSQLPPPPPRCVDNDMPKSQKRSGPRLLQRLTRQTECETRRGRDLLGGRCRVPLPRAGWRRLAGLPPALHSYGLRLRLYVEPFHLKALAFTVVHEFYTPLDGHRDRYLYL